ncbi:MAG: O-antigen ligase family protein [Chloroflexota bacterium]
MQGQPVYTSKRKTDDTGKLSTWMQSLIYAAALLVVILSSYLVATTPYGFYLLGAVIAAVGGLVVINRPSIGVYVLVMFVYLNLSDILEVQFGIPSANKLLVALIAVAILGTRLIIQRKPLVFGVGGALIILHSIIIIVSVLAGNPLLVDTGVMLDIVKDLAILFIILQVSTSEKTWKTAQWVLLGSAALLSLLTAYQAVTGNYEQEFFGLAQAPFHQIVGEFDSARPTGPVADPNFYAMLLLMVVPIGVYRVYGEKDILLRAIAAIATGLIMLAIILTYSRTAFIMMIAVAGLIALERKYNIYTLGLLAVSAVTIAIPFLPSGFMERLATMGQLARIATDPTAITEASLRGRTSQVLAALYMVRDYPILGVGYDNYPDYYLEFSAPLGLDNRLEARDTHNLFLESLAETGIIGFGAFMTMLGMIIWLLQKRKQLMEEIGRVDLSMWLSGVQFGLIAYLLTSMALHDDYIRYFRLILALAAGGIIMANAVYAEHKAEKRKREAHKRHDSLDSLERSDTMLLN